VGLDDVNDAAKVRDLQLPASLVVGSKAMAQLVMTALGVAPEGSLEGTFSLSNRDLADAASRCKLVTQLRLCGLPVSRGQ
jgi:hypothetical protein